MADPSRVLLDSHAFLWALGGSELLGSQVREALDDANTEVWQSAGTVWELGIKVALGRLYVPMPLREMVRLAVVEAGVRVLDVTPEHALRAAELPLHHRDPFDRMLVAQAVAGALTLASRDRKLARYGLPLIW